jgi:hypothetical protein
MDRARLVLGVEQARRDLHVLDRFLNVAAAVVHELGQLVEAADGGAEEGALRGVPAEVLVDDERQGAVGEVQVRGLDGAFAWVALD